MERGKRETSCDTEVPGEGEGLWEVIIRLNGSGQVVFTDEQAESREADIINS